MAAVKAYLTELRLEQYTDSFIAHGFDDVSKLLITTADDHKNLGMSVEQSGKLLRSFAEVEEEIEFMSARDGLKLFDTLATPLSSLVQLVFGALDGGSPATKSTMPAAICNQLQAPDNPNIGFWFDGLVARHLDDDEVVEYPVVFGNGPMARFQSSADCFRYFEVTISELRQKADVYGFSIGLTRADPSGFSAPLYPEDVPDSWSLGYTGIYFEPGLREPSPLKKEWNPKTLKIGDRVGLLVDSTKISVVVNDDVEDPIVGPLLETPFGAEDKLWPFVGLIGSVLEVTLLPTAAPACWKPDASTHAALRAASASIPATPTLAEDTRMLVEAATAEAAADAKKVAAEAAVDAREMAARAAEARVATAKAGAMAAIAASVPTLSFSSGPFSPPARDSAGKSPRVSLKVCRRKACRYGKNCFRHNPDHLLEFAHPGDTNYRFGLVEFDPGTGPEFETYKNMFDFIDANASGYISKDEFQNCFDVCRQLKTSSCASADDAWVQVAGRDPVHINFNMFASWVAKNVGLKLPLGLEKHGARRPCRFVPPGEDNGRDKPCECTNYEPVEGSILCKCGHKSSLHRSDQAAYTCSRRASFSIISQPTPWTVFEGLIEVTDDKILADLQALLVQTHKTQDAWTRDRGCVLHGVNGCSMSCASKNRVKVPHGYKLHKAFRNQKADLWKRYTMMKTNILADCAHPGSEVPYEARTVLSHRQLDQDLDPNCNEWRLFHGSSWEKCLTICQTNFSVALAGTGATWKDVATADKGVPLYGYGVYFAENITKADEYSQVTSLGTIMEELERGTRVTIPAKAQAKPQPPAKPKAIYSSATASTRAKSMPKAATRVSAKMSPKASMRAASPKASLRAASPKATPASASPAVPIATPKAARLSALAPSPGAAPIVQQDLYTVLFCRVVGGKSNLVTTNEIDKEKLWGDVFNGLHHSVFGDRVVKLKKPYREFVVYDKDQVYPEFLLVYERL